MSKLAIWVTALLVLALVLGGVGCGGEETDATAEIDGALPIWHIGDKWVSRGAFGGIEHTMTAEVIGEDVVEGKDCYAIAISYDPPVGGLAVSMIASVDKATMFPMRIEISGGLLDMLFAVTSTRSYQFTGAPHYPLYVGKELEVIETETTTRTVGGETETETETKTNTGTYKVEAIEDITVPAGTFRSFKVVHYDDQGTALTTSWESPETRQYTVKQVNHESGDTFELISYSVR